MFLHTYSVSSPNYINIYDQKRKKKWPVCKKPAQLEHRLEGESNLRLNLTNHQQNNGIYFPIFWHNIFPCVYQGKHCIFCKYT